MRQKTVTSFKDVLRRYFKKVYPEKYFIDKTSYALNKLGFTVDNTITCVGVCRDEISQTFVDAVNSRWDYVFSLSSLAGMFFAGKTGLLAAMHHSPNADGKERYLFYAFPHIAISEEGRMGACRRKGRQADSTACGALNAFQKELTLGKVNPTMDFSDIELSLIKTRLLREIPYGDIPNLLELTIIAQKAIQADLESAIENIVNTNVSNYAIITGIQIHGPDGNYVWPASCYAIIDGKKRNIKIV